MTHEQMKEQLGEWLDGELDAASYACLSSHLDDCASCKGEVLRLRRLGSALFKAALPPDPVSTEAFVARVRARVEAESIPFWERFAARCLAPAFGLALAGLLLTIALPPSDDDAPLGVAVWIDADTVLEVTP